VGVGERQAGAERLAHLYGAAVGLEGELLELLAFSLHQRRDFRQHHAGVAPESSESRTSFSPPGGNTPAAAWSISC
jgi:hypothetical protein